MPIPKLLTMNTIRKICLVVTLGLAPFASAQVFVGSDNFNDSLLTISSGTITSGLWASQSPNQSGTGGAWTEQNGVMNYSNSVGTGFNRGWLTWANTSTSAVAAGTVGLATTSAYTSSWSARVDVTNLLTSLPNLNAYTFAGVEVYTVGLAPNSYLLSYSGIALTTHGTWGSRVISESGTLNGALNNYNPTYGITDTAGLTSAVLRLDYDAATTTINTYYSTNAGATFIQQASYNIGSGLAFTPNGGLGLRFYAGENQNAGTIAIGQMSYDNFSVTAAAIPEPSTYVAIFGVCALGFVVWRRRGARPAQG